MVYVKQIKMIKEKLLPIKEEEEKKENLKESKIIKN